MIKTIITSLMFFSASACTSHNDKRNDTTSENSNTSLLRPTKASLSDRSDKIIPAMYDFAVNPDREVYELATAILSDSSECVGHFNGDYSKQFFTYIPSTSEGTISQYTMAGDRYRRQYQADKQGGGMRVVLKYGSTASQLFNLSKTDDQTLFKITALSKEDDGQIVMYGGNLLQSQRGIMQSRIVEIVCGRPTSAAWAEKVRHWKERAETLSPNNFPYV